MDGPQCSRVTFQGLNQQKSRLDLQISLYILVYTRTFTMGVISLLKEHVLLFPQRTDKNNLPVRSGIESPGQETGLENRGRTTDTQ